MKFVGDGQELLSMLVMNLPLWWLMMPQGLQCNQSDLCTATDPNTPNLSADDIAADSWKLAEGLSPEHKAMGSMNGFLLDEAVIMAKRSTLMLQRT
jgi:hypothetical protein